MNIILKKPTSSLYLWRGGCKGHGKPFHFLSPMQTLPAITMKNITYFWKYVEWGPAKHTEFLYKHMTAVDVFGLKQGKLTGIIPTVWSDTSVKTMHSNSKMTFPFQKSTKETEAQGKTAKVALFPMLLDSPLNSTTSSFPSLSITENQTLQNWDADSSQPINKWHKSAATPQLQSVWKVYKAKQFPTDISADLPPMLFVSS